MQYPLFSITFVFVAVVGAADYALDAPDASLSIDATPVGNGASTKTALRVEGTTGAETEREFLVSFGLTSSSGQNASGTPYKDKVALYTSIVAEEGTGDVWAINPLLTMSANSGDDYNAQGIELDFNNENAHRGDDDGAGGLAPPVAYGLAVTGAGNFRSTAAVAIMGAEHQWNRGVVGCANNAVVQATFADYCSTQEASLDIKGAPKFGIRQSDFRTTRNLFRGRTGVGRYPEENFSLTVGGTEKSTAGLLVDSGVWIQPRLADSQISMPTLEEKTASSVISKLRVTENSILQIDPRSVSEVMPSLVRKVKSNTIEDLAMSMDGIVALLVKGMKEQEETIQGLLRRLADLEAGTSPTRPAAA